MWQRYNDCIICECKSIPNVQGLIIDSRSRNILVAFNKVLHIWRFEKPESVLRNSIDDAYNSRHAPPMMSTGKGGAVQGTLIAD